MYAIDPIGSVSRIAMDRLSNVSSTEESEGIGSKLVDKFLEAASADHDSKVHQLEMLKTGDITNPAFLLEQQYMHTERSITTKLVSTLMESATKSFEKVTSS